MLPKMAYNGSGIYVSFCLAESFILPQNLMAKIA
jgi:hypothetical protein